MDICPACGYREQGLSGFCDRCEAESAVERYRENRGQEIDRQKSSVVAATLARRREEEGAA